MQHIVTLPDERELKFYYNNKVYSPEYSSYPDVLVLAGFVGAKADSIIDIACGTGVVGLSLKKMLPASNVILCDIDSEAVRVTKLNAKRLGIDVKVFGYDMLPPGQFHLVTANLPTFDAEQMLSEELHGPAITYDGGEDGLELYRKLFTQAKGRVGVLVCECQKKHQERFLELVASEGYTLLLRNEMAFAFTETMLPS